MRFAGIDLGSRSIKQVVIDSSGKILAHGEIETTFDPLGQCRKLMDGLRFDRIQATGYGRHLFKKDNEVEVVSEILANAAGAWAVVPEARAVLDIGGQDIKVVSLGWSGRVLKFEMNDRCAAGTGKFLEVMARAFGLGIEEFGIFALSGTKPSKISSMCTVFAESEATSLMAKGESPANIALGLHIAVAERAAAMVRRVTRETPLVFTGGVARNVCMRQFIMDELGERVVVPENPHLVGALGAALLLANKAKALAIER